ncbi:MAG: hypothetical protein IJU84_02295, partial [Clostridia bacterium]|nr:hypothetical protein [Clostridia bacterium]
MKKRNKFFAIAVLAILSVCFSALCAVFASADSAGSGVNITSWGDAESGDFGALTAVTTEKFGGEHSFEIPSEKQVRITSPSTDGMLYKGTLKVKAAEAGTTFKLIATATSQTTAGGWDYSYLFWDDATLGTEWADYSFDLCYRYDGEEKALYYSKDGRTESKQENVASPVAGFDLIFRVNGTVYVDDISIVSAGIPESPLKLPAYTVGETVYAWDFEDGIQGWYGEGGSVIRNTDEETDVAHGGNYAVKTTGVWTRQMNADPSVKWLTEGYFFEASMYARKGDAAQSAKAVSEMFIWGANAENDEWEMCNTRIVVIPGSEVYDDYTLVKSIFGVYSDGTNSYAYHANGNDRKMILEKLPITTGKLITYQYALDIGEKNAGTIWADDISIKKATVCKDAKITVEGYENVTLTVSQNGTELATQPAVESEGNVYTVKNLAFEKFSTAYTINIKSNGETVKSVEVDFVNSEKNIGKEYDAALTVKTENGDIVTDATVTVGDR